MLLLYISWTPIEEEIKAYDATKEYGWTKYHWGITLYVTICFFAIKLYFIFRFKFVKRLSNLAFVDLVEVKVDSCKKCKDKKKESQEGI